MTKNRYVEIMFTLPEALALQTTLVFLIEERRKHKKEVGKNGVWKDLISAEKILRGQIKWEEKKWKRGN